MVSTQVAPAPERALGVFPAPGAGVWRCDLHPAFDRAGDRVALNVVAGGTRRVAVLNVSAALARPAASYSYFPLQRTKI